MKVGQKKLIARYHILLYCGMSNTKEVISGGDALGGVGGRVGDLMDSVQKSMDEKSSGGKKIVPHEKEDIYKDIQEIDDQLSKIKSVLKSL